MTPSEIICPTCHISQEKAAATFTAEERRLRYFSRSLRVVAVLLAIGGVLTVTAYTSFLRSHPVTTMGVMGIVVGIASLVTAVGLYRYQRWTFYASTLIFCLGLLLNMLARNFFGIPMAALCLYYVTNSTSRRILLKRP